MSARFDWREVSPEGYAAMINLGAKVHAGGLDPVLVELMKIRVSQLNGCAFCVDLHVGMARKLGVEHGRLHLLATWREAPCFNAVERAALDWAETLTRLPESNVSDAAYERTREHFDLADLATLTLAIVEINAWNRLMMAARTPPMGRASSPAP
jgi:AhpD family alkylhydroperoxidase